MPPYRAVTDRFAAAPQIRPDDLAAIAAAGYATVVSNRPDGEEPGQPTAAEMAEAARAAGLAFVSIPISGAPTIPQVEAMAEVLGDSAAPVFAFCRSGTRSITVWALASAYRGEHKADALLEAARLAGYDLGAYRVTLERLSDQG